MPALPLHPEVHGHTQQALIVLTTRYHQVTCRGGSEEYDTREVQICHSGVERDMGKKVGEGICREARLYMHMCVRVCHTKRTFRLTRVRCRGLYMLR